MDIFSGRQGAAFFSYYTLLHPGAVLSEDLKLPVFVSFSLFAAPVPDATKTDLKQCH